MVLEESGGAPALQRAAAQLYAAAAALGPDGFAGQLTKTLCKRECCQCDLGVGGTVGRHALA